MTVTDHIVSISGVEDRGSFFEALLAFYAPVNVVLTTWGKLPDDAIKALLPFRAPCPWFRRRFFREYSWYLNQNSIQVLTDNLCKDEVLESLTWGLLKEGTSLGLARGWDDMNLDSSEYVSDTELLDWIESLSREKVIESYETIMT
jgi:hypothetical protein